MEDLSRFHLLTNVIESQRKAAQPSQAAADDTRERSSSERAKSRNLKDQLGAEPSSQSKIRDRSTEGNRRPHRTAVFDF